MDFFYRFFRLLFSLCYGFLRCFLGLCCGFFRCFFDLCCGFLRHFWDFCSRLLRHFHIDASVRFLCCGFFFIFRYGRFLFKFFYLFSVNDIRISRFPLWLFFRNFRRSFFCFIVYICNLFQLFNFICNRISIHRFFFFQFF